MHLEADHKLFFFCQCVVKGYQAQVRMTSDYKTNHLRLEHRFIFVVLLKVKKLIIDSYFLFIEAHFLWPCCYFLQ